MNSDTPPKSPADVIVVGRANIDLTIRVPFRPGPGHVAFASDAAITPGGKSLNQAIAVARLGGRTCLVANVGDDPWGQLVTTHLTDAGVDVAQVQRCPGIPTGVAIVEVTPDGENSIVLAISQGTELTRNQVEGALNLIDAPILVVQLDLPPAPLVTALTESRPGMTRIGNLVPNPEVDRDLMRLLDVFVVNQHEAGAILEDSDVDPLAAAQRLRDLGPASVVVTAGPQGAAFSHADGSGTIAAATVPVVDTTGAGDAFLGCLALDLSRGVALTDAVSHAVRIGSDAVQHEGAQLSRSTPGADHYPAH